ncbi:GntR family transcriptional regulator [Paenibacillus larvae]|uniref:GntR family transcriptional regulator n=1 Tax=Paenibacillus larvae TaxID=1464 RepID=UPI002853A9B8|nr:GntR family transcriptional regulator [Paenibacillus larvae]MDR5601542.1 GntR family transcriptional regulator [Paenibacillus larvae]
MTIPKYQQIKQSLLYKIKNGQFQPGDKFYSEAELRKEYNVSAITVIRAVQELTNEGYLVRYQGKGTYVSKARIGKIVKFTEREKYRDKSESVQVLQLEKIADPRISKELKLPAKTPFYLIKRLRLIDGMPFILQHSYVPLEFIKEEDTLDPSAFTSVYEKIREYTGINLFQANSEELTEICFPTPKEESELLQIGINEPSAFVRRHTYLFDGRVAEYIESYKRWDYFSVKIESV